MKKYIECLRISHYLKNLIILAPLFFNKSIMNWELLQKALLGFVAFCLLSSGIYIINDIRDADYDRLHERKKDRPIASGVVSKKNAGILSLGLIITSLVLFVFINHSWLELIWSVIYFVMNFIYSFGGKHIPILDVILLSAGYPIRLLYGGAICDITVSAWLFLTVLSISLFLGIGKRRGEYLQNGNITRPVLSKYSQGWIDGTLYMMLGLGIMFYSLWAIEKSIDLVYTVPIVLVICMYYT